MHFHQTTHTHTHILMLSLYLVSLTRSLFDSLASFRFIMKIHATHTHSLFPKSKRSKQNKKKNNRQTAKLHLEINHWNKKFIHVFNRIRTTQQITKAMHQQIACFLTVIWLFAFVYKKKKKEKHVGLSFEIFFNKFFLSFFPCVLLQAPIQWQTKALTWI